MNTILENQAFIDSIISIARSAIKTPFVHQGRIAGKALDCAGLVIYVAKELNLEYIDAATYSRNPTDSLLEDALDRQPCLERVVGEPQAGNILLMRFTGDPQHLGIYTGKTLIHAWQPPGQVCEHDLTPIWRRRIVRTYRFRNLNE